MRKVISATKMHAANNPIPATSFACMRFIELPNRGLRIAKANVFFGSIRPAARGIDLYVR